MQSLSIHGVTAIEVLPLFIHPSIPETRWQTIKILHRDGLFCIDLFPAEGSNAEIKEGTPKTPTPKLITFGPNHHCIQLGEKTYYFSYTTCIAYKDCFTKARIRSCSRTTGRHMLSMDCAHFAVLEDDEFLKLIS